MASQGHLKKQHTQSSKAREYDAASLGTAAGQSTTNLDDGGNEQVVAEGTAWENNGGVDDLAAQYQEIISVCKSNQNDKRMFDVFVSLKAMPRDRHLITITQKQDFTSFFSRVREVLEIQYEQFQGLKGLRVTEIKKYQPLLENPKQEVMILDHVQEQDIYENMEDLVFKTMKAGDRLFVGIDSQELWLKVSLEMRDPDTISFQSDFEVKIDQKTKGKELKMVIQKLSIALWNRLCSEDQHQKRNTVTSDDRNRELPPGTVVQPFLGQPHASLAPFQAIQNKIARAVTQRLFVLTEIQIQRYLKADEGAGHLGIGANPGARRPSSHALMQGMGKGALRASSAAAHVAEPQLAPLDDDLSVDEMFDFQGNQLLVVCDFQTVRSRYQEFMQEIYQQQQAALASQSALVRPNEREPTRTVRLVKRADKSTTLGTF